MRDKRERKPAVRPTPGSPLAQRDISPRMAVAGPPYMTIEVARPAGGSSRAAGQAVAEVVAGRFGQRLSAAPRRRGARRRRPSSRRRRPPGRTATARSGAFGRPRRACRRRRGCGDGAVVVREVQLPLARAHGLQLACPSRSRTPRAATSPRPRPASSGQMSLPSIMRSAGTAAPASFAIVGSRSIVIAGSAHVAARRGSCPGQRMMHGTRTPPSNVRPLALAQRPGRAGVVAVAAATGRCRTVKMTSVFSSRPCFFEPVEDLPDRPVDLHDHVAVQPARALALELVRHEQRHVRHRVRHVEEERLVLVARR